MKIGRWRFDRVGLRSFYNRRMRPLINPYYRQLPLRRERFIINVCNFCNLRCFSCSNLMDRQMGSNVYRNYKRVTSFKQFTKYLELIDGWRKHVWLRLTGGEPTAIGGKTISKMCQIARSFNRKIDIVSNGYRLMEIDPHLLDFITLDNHGINEEIINKCVKYLEDANFTDFKIIPFTHHRDLEHQRSNNISYGPRCREWMGTITLWQDTIYPCCVLHSIEGMENNPMIGESLKKAGWNIENPRLVETLEKWHKTIPAEVVRACVLGCWHGSERIIWKKII